MSTYNLQATDLITLLQSTVQQATGGALVNALFDAGDFPFTSTASSNYVQTDVGPDGAPLATQDDTIAKGIKFELITLPTSTAVTGATFPAPTIGTIPETNFNFLSPGGVIIGAGDQGVSVVDYNTGSKADTLIGGLGPEKLSSAGKFADSLVAGAGANTLMGGSTADTLVGAGDTRLVAGTGANLLVGGTIAGAHDTLVGGTGADTLEVTTGANRLTAGGANTLFAGSGLSTLAGAKGDTLVGADKASLVGGSGNTRLIAQDGAETLIGGSGSDTLVATSLTSSITATLGSGTTLFRDVIVGGTAPNQSQLGASATITGGTGAGKVVLGTTGDDSILSGAGAIKILSSQTLADLDPTKSTHSGATSTLVFTNGQTIVVNDVNANVTIHFSGGGSTPV